MRKSLVGFALVALVGARAAPAAAQGIVTDARRIGMGGLILQPSGLRRYNAAYRAVPARERARGQPKITIPIPLGVIQFFHDHPDVSNDPAFNPDSTGFNPVLVLNTILNLPLYYEVKKAPTPTNDVVFGIGKDSLRVNLGEAAKLVPEDEFGIGGSSRPLDPGISIKGVRVSVMGWLHDEVGFQLGDTLLGFLRDSTRRPGEFSNQAPRRLLLVDLHDLSVQRLINVPFRGKPSRILWSESGKNVRLSDVYLPLDIADPAERIARQRTKYDVEITLASLEIKKMPNGGVTVERRAAPLPVEITLREDSNTPPVLYASKADSGIDARLLDLNPQFEKLEFGPVKSFRWSTKDGRLEVEAGPGHLVAGEVEFERHRQLGQCLRCAGACRERIRGPPRSDADRREDIQI